MNLSRQFILRFVRYFVLFYIAVTCIIFAVFIAFLMLTENRFFEDDMMNNTSFSISEYVKVDGDKVTPNKEMLEFIEAEQGKLIVQNKSHRTIYTSDSDFKLQPLSTYRSNDYTTWELPKGERVIYIKNNDLIKVRQQFEKDNKQAMDDLKKYQLTLFKSVDGQLKKVAGNLDTALVNKTIFEHKNNDDFQKYYFDSFYKKGSNYFIVKENENPKDTKAIYAEDSYLYDKEFMSGMKEFLIWYGILNLVTLLIILLAALFVGQRIALPLLHFAKWIEQLAHGDYQVLNNQKIYKNGRLRRKYRMYDDIDQSIAKLTGKLADDNNYRHKMNLQRENWVRGITHDIKTPLSSIYGYAKILNSDIPLSDGEQKHFSRIIEDKSLYLDQLLKDLNMIYQLRSDGIEFHTKEIHLKDYIEAFVAQYNDNGLSYVSKEDALINIDANRMDRVLTNIVSNSFTHNHNVEVWINTFISAENVVIEVCDNGQGIPQKDLAHIFDQFYRGGKTNVHHNGSGLGLFVAKQIVELHDGRLEVVSSAGGTKFIITIPKQ